MEDGTTPLARRMFMAAPSPRSYRQEAAERLASLYCAEEVIPIVETVVAAMISAGYRENDIFDLRLALEEAILNAVKHGNRSDPAKRVLVRFSVSPERVLAEVEDQGLGFDPARVPDPTSEENLDRSCGR